MTAHRHRRKPAVASRVVLTLFHDFTSAASAVAVVRLQRLADEGLAVEFAGFEALGVDVAVPPPLGLLAEVDRLGASAAAAGLRLRRPRSLPPTVLAHVVGAVADAAARGGSWRHAAYRAFWDDQADLADPATLVALAARTGLDEAAVRSALADRARARAVRRQTAAHRRLGVGGVPTILAQRTLVPGLLDDAALRALAELP